MAGSIPAGILLLALLVLDSGVVTHASICSCKIDFFAGFGLKSCGEAPSAWESGQISTGSCWALSILDIPFSIKLDGCDEFQFYLGGNCEVEAFSGSTDQCLSASALNLASTYAQVKCTDITWIYVVVPIACFLLCSVLPSVLCYCCCCRRQETNVTVNASADSAVPLMSDPQAMNLQMAYQQQQLALQQQQLQQMKQLQLVEQGKTDPIP